jgi:hypothetical protein
MPAGRPALPAIALALLWVGCGEASSEFVSRKRTPPVAESGGAASDEPAGAAGTPPAGRSEPSGGSGGEGAGVQCTLCAVYQYCDSDDLIEQLNNDTYCDPEVTHCEFGCLDVAWGAACAIQCGENVCPPPPAETEPSPFCCTTDGRCGVSGIYSSDPPCIAAEPSAPIDVNCPEWNSHCGCCRADGICGIDDPNPGAGCVAGAELGLEPTECVGGQ